MFDKNKDLLILKNTNAKNKEKIKKIFPFITVSNNIINVFLLSS
ncbi:hypothetical protein [Rickettsia helvetica]|uniref:Uncharacterized protein n=1 Tax=Rickettsia helvetica TaxID=35789 RepID=A0ABP0T591_RICHE